MNEHGHCPHCNADLDGGLIWDTFADSGKEKADEIAAMYGATRSTGRWWRAIGIYSMERDRTVEYQCPACDGLWPA